MYTVYWYRYPHGMEDEAMTANWRDFDSLEKAINFLDGRAKLIKSINWAGGHVEDENRKWLYEIDWEGNEEDNREKFDTTDTEPETATDPETADQVAMVEKKMDDVLFETLIRNAKDFPPCDFPGATKLLNICQQMNNTQLSDFCKILIEKGIFKYEYGQIVTTKGRLLICPVPDMSGGA